MANRRSLQALTRHCPSIFSSSTSLRTFTTRPSLQPLSFPDPLSLSNPNHSLLPVFRTPFGYQYNSIRRFSIRDKFFGKNRNRDEEEEEEVDLGEGEEDDDDDEDEEDESDDEEEEEGERVSNANISRTYSVEEKAEEAAAIGYKVLGPLDPTERPFKWREPVFAVVQIGSHQFKVSNGDYIYAERLKFCEVNDKGAVRVFVFNMHGELLAWVAYPITEKVMDNTMTKCYAAEVTLLLIQAKQWKTSFFMGEGHFTLFYMMISSNLEQPWTDRGNHSLAAYNNRFLFTTFGFVLLFVETLIMRLITSLL